MTHEGGAPIAPVRSDLEALQSRVERTLAIMADRGYNPNVAMLSRMLVGGGIDPSELKVQLPSMRGIMVEDGFVFPDGLRLVERCRPRVESNGRLQDLYRGIAVAYAADLVRTCPWVRCAMLAGSAATGGLCQGDDLDLNLVVDDGRKYTTIAASTVLNRVYALKHGAAIGFRPTDQYRLPIFMCLNIVWEDRETRPFRRRDEQMAYELFACEVLHGHERYRELLEDNAWMRSTFPQAFDGGAVGPGAGRPRENGHGSPDGAIERLARGVLFGYDRAVRMYLGRRPDVLERATYYERIKHPYGLYDLPRDGGEG